VTHQGNNLNSFGESIFKGTDGFKESILRSLYRSQRDKRGLICSDYPKILEECGDVVRKQEVIQQPKQELVVKKRMKSKVVKSITKVNPKLKIDCYKKWKCIVGTCDDMINENGCLINN